MILWISIQLSNNFSPTSESETYSRALHSHCTCRYHDLTELAMHLRSEDKRHYKLTPHRGASSTQTQRLCCTGRWEPAGILDRGFVECSSEMWVLTVLPPQILTTQNSSLMCSLIHLLSLLLLIPVPYFPFLATLWASLGEHLPYPLIFKHSKAKMAAYTDGQVKNENKNRSLVETFRRTK